MYTLYNNLPDESRIWIYQANRALTENELHILSDKAIDFLNQWKRHGDALKSSFVIKYNQFLVIAVDESFVDVSGCSIDASVRFVKSLEAEFSIDFTDKLNIAFRNGKELSVLRLIDFKKAIKEVKLTKETVVFNNMLNTKKDLENFWEIPAKDSWHNSLF